MWAGISATRILIHPLSTTTGQLGGPVVFAYPELNCSTLADKEVS